MTSPLLPTSPISLDASLSFASFQPDYSNTTAFNTSSQNWVDATLANRVHGVVGANSQTYNTNAVLANITNAAQTTINSSLLQTVYQLLPNQMQASVGPISPDSIEGKPNILNQYENYTYHIRFSMATEKTAYSSNPNDKNLDKVVIAESGKTVGFNITKFSMNQTVGPGFKHQNMNATTWKMTITEPFGLTFADAMRAGAAKLKLGNYNRFPCFIEIWFNGYDEQGNILTKFDNIYKIWRVMILNCSLQTTEAGTTYELEGVTDNDLCTTNQLAITPSTITLNGVNKLQDAINLLTTELNKQTEKAENQKNSIKYEVILPQEMNGWSLISPEDLEKDRRSRNQAGGILTLNKGQDIGGFLTSIIAKCKEAGSWLEGTPETSGRGTPSTNSHGLAKYFQIVPKMEIKPGDYNNTLKDYSRTIKYYIVPFYTPRCASSIEEVQNLRRLDVQKNKFNFWKENGLLAKKYEYIYTGKNTEIIKFDISIENLWQIVVPAYLGGQTNSNYTQGAKYADNSQAVAENKGYAGKYLVGTEVVSKAAQLVDFASSITGGSISGLSDLLNNFNNSLNSFNSTINSLGSSITNITSNVGGVAGTLGINGVANFTNSLGSTVQGALGSLSLFSSNSITPFNYDFSSAVNSITNNVVNNGILAAPISFTTNPDARMQSQYIESLPKLAGIPDDGEVLQNAIWVSNEPNAQNTANNGLADKNYIDKTTSTPRSQSFFGNKIFNIYDKTYFLNITMEIRGDPWWIGMTNLEMNQYIVDAKSVSGAKNKEWTKTYANYLAGENVFLLTFKTGTDYNEQTGLMSENSGSAYFNGLYCVMSVEHKFENGRFTQTLEAYKETFSQNIDQYLTASVSPKVASVNNVANVPGIVGGGTNPLGPTVTSDLGTSPVSDTIIT